MFEIDCGLLTNNSIDNYLANWCNTLNVLIEKKNERKFRLDIRDISQMYNRREQDLQNSDRF